MICDGEQIERELPYGTVLASVVRHLLVWDADNPGGDPVDRFDDVEIIQSHLAAQTRKQGTQIGRLVQPDRRYEFVELSAADHKRMVDWLIEYMGPGGVLNWPTKADDKPKTVPPDEAPF